MKLSSQRTRLWRLLPILSAMGALGCSGSISDPELELPPASAAGSSMAQPAPEGSLSGDAAMGGAAPVPTSSPSSSTLGAKKEQAAASEPTAAAEAPMATEAAEAAEPPVVCDAVRLVLQPKCGGSDCHVGPGIGSFGAGEKEAFSYVDKPPVSSAAVCGLMIDSANPERSFILTKVTGRRPYTYEDCKDLMPLGRSMTDEDIACLRSWLGQFRR